MFGLFKKKHLFVNGVTRPTVTENDKYWIEENMIWLIKSFGMESLRKEPFLLPLHENFPYNDLADAAQFQRLFEQLCNYWQIDPATIRVKFFDDVKSKQWSSLMPAGAFNEPGGIYYEEKHVVSQPFVVEIAKSNLHNLEILVTVLAHELAHVKLLGGRYVDEQAGDMEPLTDLACIYQGFGIFMANTCQHKDVYWVSKSGYLPNELISYTNALIGYITGFDREIVAGYLNTNTRSLFIQDSSFLSNTNDTILTPAKQAEAVKRYTVGKTIDEAFNKRDLDTAIAGCHEWVAMEPQNKDAFNFLGYGFLMKKKYAEAIVCFTKAIDIDPYYAYAFNNRGYCKLQMGELESGLVDVQSSCNMDPENAFAWRNLGVYELFSGDAEKALAYFEKAAQMNAATELINFYLAQAHTKLGNYEKAAEFAEKYKSLDEHNDSVLL